ncbi:divalent metal cation transporter [Siphonobacter sp. BAB-5405]|uniref:Nramp family divalent metal transporter n=1 Tax=Siphonobacter sp. BAB-5405 TaxID=1864825 RepID=UPI000C80BDEC|nr:Nramp family divalent metal transporter [Siphonobacter sp. BAB-5405]PMD96240.1 divalent metal cation transporter [Siphonobacter sp. BAB-5405]
MNSPLSTSDSKASPFLEHSLPEAHASVRIPEGASNWRKFLAFAGPGLMVAVGYMDPGNWATDIEGGARFGYTLLSVILISNLFAMILQHLALKLGIATGRDLAQACRDQFSRPVGLTLWVLAEIAIAATDVAEVLGSAIALNLLFGLPLTVGVVITILDVLVILYFQNRGFRALESIVGGLIFVILCCFIYQMVASHPSLPAIVQNLIPRPEIVMDRHKLYVAIGILGATVMPHNLYLHSSIVQTRGFTRDDRGRREAVKFATLDSTLSLLLAFFINASILIVAAAAFHSTGNQSVADITDAHRLLDPVLGVKLAGISFAVALLAAGQNSTVTGTLAGQIVMEGFLNLRLKPWIRRLLTRSIAIIPAFVATLLYGEKGTSELLVFSQVVLSIQLSFAVVPLVWFTSRKDLMGSFVNARWLSITSWIIAAIIFVLNLYLIIASF